MDLVFKREVGVFLMSMLPLSELRGAIPLGLSLGLAPRLVFLISILGNMLIVPILLRCLGPVLRLVGGMEVFSPLVSWARERTVRRTREKIRKYRVLGLFLFVALPLPTTGAWTGCLAANIFKLDFKKSLFAIWMGILASALIVSSLSYQLIL